MRTIKMIQNICAGMMLLCFIGLYSCSDNEETVLLETSVREISLDVMGLSADEEVSFEVSTTALSWKAVHPDWLSLSAITGGTGSTEVTVTASVTSEDREGYITITSKNRRVVITVRQSSQESVPSTLTVTPATISVAANGLTEEGISPSIKISTNKKWQISGLPAWITATPASGNAGTDIAVNLTVLEYTDTQRDRTANIIVGAGSKSETVILDQFKKEGPPPAVSASWMLPAATFADGIASDGSANLNVNEWWVKSDDGSNSILRSFRAGETSNNQKTMSYTTSNPADGDRLLLYGMVLNDYWQMEIPVTGIPAGTVLKIEGEMQSSGTGPRDFLFQYSADKNTWTPINPQIDGDVSYTVRLGSAVKTPILQEFTVTDAIPAGTFYIRLLISGPNSANGGASIGAGGTCRICRPQYTNEADKQPIMKVSTVSP
jgi:hypothetical protein